MFDDFNIVTVERITDTDIGTHQRVGQTEYGTYVLITFGY